MTLTRFVAVPSGRLTLLTFALSLLLFASGCAAYRDPEPTSTRQQPTSESWTRLEESWGPGEFAALLTGTVSSKDRNFWLNIPFASWYVREQDRKGGGILGGALAYDMVTVKRHQGRAESKKMTSVGFLGLAGRLEERRLDGSREFSKHNWLFPLWRYKNVNGQRTVYPFFIFPIALKDEPAGAGYDPNAMASVTGAPIDPAGVSEYRPAVEVSELLDPPPFDDTLEGNPYDAPDGLDTAGLDPDSDWDVEPVAAPRNSGSGALRRASLDDGWNTGAGRSDTRRTDDNRGGGSWKAEIRPAAPTTVSYRVRKGDSLYGIARKHYGKGGEWKRIYEANRGVLGSPEKIKEGMVLRIPQ